METWSDICPFKKEKLFAALQYIPILRILYKDEFCRVPQRSFACMNDHKRDTTKLVLNEYSEACIKRSTA